MRPSPSISRVLKKRSASIVSSARLIEPLRSASALATHKASGDWPGGSDERLAHQAQIDRAARRLRRGRLRRDGGGQECQQAGCKHRAHRISVLWSCPRMPRRSARRHYRQNEAEPRPNGPASLADLAHLEADDGVGEMAFERAPPLRGVGGRSPHDQPAGAALLDVDDVDRSILRRPLRARLGRGRLQVGVALRPAAAGSGWRAAPPRGRPGPRSRRARGPPASTSANAIFRVIPCAYTSGRRLGRRASALRSA